MLKHIKAWENTAKKAQTISIQPLQHPRFRVLSYRTIPYPKTRVMSNVFTPQYELSEAVIYSNFSIKVLRARPALCMVLEFVKISILGELTSL